MHTLVVLRRENRRFFKLGLLIAILSTFLIGCQEAETLKRELVKTAQSSVLKPKKTPFTPRDGMTTKTCSLFQTANPNSEIIKKLPAETPVFLLEKIGEWYRVRTRDGREGYVEQKVIGGEEMIARTIELRRSIEGVSSQAEGVTKTKANFRLYPGRQHEIIETLPPDKKFEVYERVVTVRGAGQSGDKISTRTRTGGPAPVAEEVQAVDDLSDSGIKKDVWYKVKIEDGRVGYIHTYNMKLTPPRDIERLVPWMRLVAWRAVSSTDDPDRGAKPNYLLAYAPIGKDAGCDYTVLYLMNWAPKKNSRVNTWQSRVRGVLPITNYQYEGKPGFSVRLMHPSKKDKLILAGFVLSGGGVKKASEEEIPNTAELH